VTHDRKRQLSRVRRMVVKIGSSLLTNEKAGGIQSRFLGNLALQIRGLQKQGIETLIVTSGAISAGMFELGLSRRPKVIPALQALAAVGQCNLMHAYERIFGKHGLKVAQLLLTWDDLSSRKRYMNARNMLTQIFRHQIIPIVNENDTVAVEEIRFGDNDTLAGLVAHLVGADLLVLLTDTEGFFNEDPRFNPNAKLLSDIYRLTSHLEKSATQSHSKVGTGGMATKIMAAKKMMRGGTPVVIANGIRNKILTRILAGQTIGTFFHPLGARGKERKNA